MPFLPVRASRTLRRIEANRSTLTAAAILVALALFLQWRSGAYRSDFTADDDEPAHAVSSLLVRDYLVHDFPHKPLPFAEAYYVHYPKVAIGHWPPLFYAGEAGWMLVFGRNRAAMLSFVAVTEAVLLVSVFLWVTQYCGALAGFLSGVVLAVPAFMETAAYSVAPNCLLALLAFWAAAVYARYLVRGRTRDVVLFAALAIACVGVHGRGAAVAFIPLIAVFFRRPFSVAWWHVLVLAFCAVLLVAPAWLGQAEPFSLRAGLTTLRLFLYRACVSLGWPVAIIAATGGVWAFRNAQRQTQWIAMLALVLGGCVFQSFANVGWDDRYLVTAAPGLAVLFGVGFHSYSQLFASGRGRLVVATAMFLLVCGVSTKNVISTPRKPDLGYHRLVREEATALAKGPVYLAAGNPRYEGAFVSEVCLRDRQPSSIVLRASKVLAQSTWLGLNYRLEFPDNNAVAAYLDQAHVGTIVMEAVDMPPHMAQLEAALRLHPLIWTEVHATPQPPHTRIFERIGPLPDGPPNIRIDMRKRLGTYLNASP